MAKAKSGSGESWLSKFGLSKGEDTSILADVSGHISSGVSLLDANMGGGFPMGRLVEVFGPESSGKSSLAFQTIGNCQDAGGTAVIFDCENTFDREFAKGFGVDADRLTFLDPTLPLETVFARINGISTELRKRMPDKPILFVWDTLNATPTKKEIENAEKGEYAVTVGGHRAQVIRGLLRSTCARISKSQMCLLMLNHVYEEIGGMSYGPTKKTPGGMGPKYFASIRIFIRPSTTIKNGSGEPAGHKVAFEVVKNKVGVPKRKCTTRFYYGSGMGYDDRWSIFDYIYANDLIAKGSGGWCTVESEEEGGKPIKFQSTKWIATLDEHPGLFDRLKDLAVSHYSSSLGY